MEGRILFTRDRSVGSKTINVRLLKTAYRLKNRWVRLGRQSIKIGCTGISTYEEQLNSHSTEKAVRWSNHLSDQLNNLLDIQNQKATLLDASALSRCSGD